MHPEALNEKGKEIFPKLTEFADFYLAGGTALALQIGHRISFDFDFFSKKLIDKNLLGKIKRIFSDKQIKPSVNNKDELTVFIDDTKLTFLYYSFSLKTDECQQYQGVNLLSVKEIAATKAYTIGRRGSFRDYIDLYFIILEKYASLDKIIELAEEKYGNEFNSRLFLEQLVYLKDIEDTEIVFLKDAVNKGNLEIFFAGEIKKINL